MSSKKQFRSQASSGRAAGGFGAFSSSAFGSTESSTLSYIQEAPDYTKISDVNVVVAFKNLSKKDSTTKAKALEDIQAHIAQPDTEIEDGFLEAWVKLFPRLSIDSARRVRQLAHSTNGSICSKSGKRTAKHLPKIAGPWLAGCYDNDRAAAKAASDALSLVFASPEKVFGLKKTFQGAIVAYCRDASLHETVQTLSDERAVSADDAAATYARVVATSLALVTDLLDQLPAEETSKHEEVYEELLGQSKLWDFACHSDAGVRRATHRLMQTALVMQPVLVESNRKLISTAYIYKGLTSDQTGSATDYVTTLERSSTRFPTLWTEDYSGKKPAVSRLKQFLKHGSRSGPKDFWIAAKSFFEVIPSSVLPKGHEDAKDLLVASRDGVTRREERFSASAAWPAYFTLVTVVVNSLEEDERMKILSECVMPVVEQYLHPSPETADWSIHGSKTAALVAQATHVPGSAALLEREWPRYGERLVEAAKTSQPQQSKDFDKSQLQVASAGERWAALQRELCVLHASETIEAALLASNVKVAGECASVLKNREGKPYGAAAILEELVRERGSDLLKDVDFRDTLQNLLRANDFQWLLWPSTTNQRLIRCLYSLKSEHFFKDLFKGVLTTTLGMGESSEATCRLLRDLFAHNVPPEAVALANANMDLQDFANNAAAPGLNDTHASMFLQVYNAGALSEETSDKAFTRLINSLAQTEDKDVLLGTLQFFTAMDATLLRGLAAKPKGDQLVPNVLRLEQHDNESIAQSAAAISSRLSAASGQAGIEAKFDIVHQSLGLSDSKKSLSMDALRELTDRILGEGRNVQDVNQAMPSTKAWQDAISMVAAAPKPSLAILSPLGGAVNLEPYAGGNASTDVQTDADGLSVALRIAIYASHLLAETNARSELAKADRQWTFVPLLYVTVLLAEDNLSVVGTNSLWHPRGGAQAEATVLDFITEANAVLNEYWDVMVPMGRAGEDAKPTAYDQMKLALEQFRRALHSSSNPLRYYIALADARITSNLFELHGHNAEQARASEATLRAARSGKDALATAACLVGQQHPLTGTQTLTRFCNELVADLTAIDLSSSEHKQKSLEQLVTLNTILQTQEDAVASIAKQRLIFLVKRLLPALEGGIYAAEICKLLCLLLPSMRDMYGEHWSQALTYVLRAWESLDTQPDGKPVAESRVLLLHATLRLYGTLRKLSKSEEPNDDLVETLKDNGGKIYQGLVTLLKAANGVSDEAHQPLMLTHELLARQIQELQYQVVDDVEELFPLLYTPSHPIQQGAFDLLHRQIPLAQEQISLDVALENKTAHFPDELLSLILEAPTLDSLVDASFDRTMPLPLQGYLYSWRLLFDHFTGSSYRVKTDYIDQLKEGTYLSGLLSFTFDFLGHSRGKPIEASKFDIQEYVADTEPSPERDVQWLLTHLYYLALTHLPSLTKSYYLDIRSRQTSLAVESWTAKYIAPLIVNASLQAVAEWAEKSVREDPEYEKMSVKVGMRSKEINIGYIVDEQTMAVKVVLPEAYPLASAQVVGVSRVAVKEEKWQSWLRNCQGVITFSNGSIIDGLSAWRKNVTGALKGQTECAICYSIIDAHRQLPSKRCPTCKNLFHSGCLVKWFKTSNASTCPLCRNSFNFN